MGYICQFASIASMVVSKLVLVSNLLIYAPYVYPIGMILEFAIISLIAWCLKRKKILIYLCNMYIHSSRS